MNTVTVCTLCYGIFFDRQNSLYMFLTIQKPFVSDVIEQNILSDVRGRVDFLTQFLVESEKIDAIMCT